MTYLVSLSPSKYSATMALYFSAVSFPILSAFPLETSSLSRSLYCDAMSVDCETSCHIQLASLYASSSFICVAAVIPCLVGEIGSILGGMNKHCHTCVPLFSIFYLEYFGIQHSSAPYLQRDQMDQKRHPRDVKRLSDPCFEHLLTR